VLTPPAARRRPPGSDWLYLKLYGPRVGEDALLSGPVRAFADEVTSTGEVDSWFFVRYADPDPHLRFRLHGAPDRLRRLLPVAARWAGDLVGNGSCERFAVDVYEREVERYGGEAGVTLAERLAGIDSVATVALLGLLDRAVPGVPPRTGLGLLSLDDLLSALGLDEDVVARLCDRERIRPQESADEYRRRKEAWQRLFADHRTTDAGAPGAGELARVLGGRRAALALLSQELRSLEDVDQLTQPLESIAASYVHLHCNRLLGTDQHTERLVLDLLRRLRTWLHHRTPR
jgi:thiopeptide-type bacteriocin biosynthesis protein